MTRLADVLAPPNDEGTRATVLRWCKQVGDAVVKDEPLVELETDKVTVEIPAPASGTLVEVLKEANDEVKPDEVLARLSLAVAAAAPRDAGRPASPEREAPAAAVSAESEAPGQGQLSPAVRRLLKEHALSAADVRGTGHEGRITAQDVERHVAAAHVRLHTRRPHRHRPRTARDCRTPPFAGGWPSTWRAVCWRRRMSPPCSRRI